MRRLESAEDLLAVTHNDVYARGSLRRPFASGWTIDGATAWIGLDNEEQRPYLCVLGEAEAGARLLSDIREELPSTESRVTVLRSVGDQLSGQGLALVEGEDWEFRWTSTAAKIPMDIRWTQDLEEVDALLVEHSPSASARPGAAHVVRWAGGFDRAKLVTVAADTSGVAGIGHISSVATDTSRRGEGWGAGITSWLTHELLGEGCEFVTLGMWAGNETAIRLYSRLGFTGVHRFRSGTLGEVTT